MKYGLVVLVAAVLLLVVGVGGVHGADLCTGLRQGSTGGDCPPTGTAEPTDPIPTATRMPPKELTPTSPPPVESTPTSPPEATATPFEPQSEPTPTAGITPDSPGDTPTAPAPYPGPTETPGAPGNPGKGTPYPVETLPVTGSPGDSLVLNGLVGLVCFGVAFVLWMRRHAAR